MNLSEFKAWFEGFSEGIDDVPSKKQWKRINEKIESITSDPTPWPVFVERYIYPRRERWNYWPTHYAVGGGTIRGTVTDKYTLNGGGSVGKQCSNTAFADLGRIEALEAA